MFAAAGQFSSLKHDESIEFHKFMSDLFLSTSYDDQDQDATGFFSWGGDRTAHGKRGVSPADFVKSDKAWESLHCNPQLLYLCHARGAMSDASDPNNNHPFVGNNVALMHEGWLSGHLNAAVRRGLTLTTQTDSEFYMRLADQRRLPLGDREGWEPVKCMRAMLKMTSEPTALCFIDHSSPRPNLFFARNESSGNHPFFFYYIKKFRGAFLTSTEEMMTIASHLNFDNVNKEVVKVDIKVKAGTVYKMAAFGGTISEYKSKS